MSYGHLTSRHHALNPSPVPTGRVRRAWRLVFLQSPPVPKFYLLLLPTLSQSSAWSPGPPEKEIIRPFDNSAYKAVLSWWAVVLPDDLETSDKQITEMRAREWWNSEGWQMVLKKETKTDVKSEAKDRPNARNRNHSPLRTCLPSSASNWLQDPPGLRSVSSFFHLCLPSSCPKAYCSKQTRMSNIMAIVIACVTHSDANSPLSRLLVPKQAAAHTQAQMHR